MTVCDKQGKILALVDYSKRDKHASEIVSNRQRKIATHPQKLSSRSILYLLRKSYRIILEKVC